MPHDDVARRRTKLSLGGLRDAPLCSPRCLQMNLPYGTLTDKAGSRAAGEAGERGGGEGRGDQRAGILAL